MVLILSFAFLLATIPFSSKSKNDTTSVVFQNEFKKNLAELNNLPCWSDLDFYLGKFKMNSVVNIQTEFQNLNLPFFIKLEEQAEEFLKFLESLNVENKQNIIRSFSYYENEIETALRLNDLPLQLKYLAPVISAMNPTATSYDGKAGVWQLTHFQAVLNGAVINKLVDERFLFSASTKAAVSELKRDFTQFDTPELAIVAYLFGNVKVVNAIQNSGIQSEEANVFDFLHNSINEFVAFFQAMAIFLNANVFEEQVMPFAVTINLDTVTISQQLHFQQISNVLQIPEKQLKFLNPQYKFSIVPGNIRPTRLFLPHGKWDDFVLWQDSIYNAYDSTLFRLVAQKIEYPPSPNRQYIGEPVKDLEIEGKTKIQYRLKTGDVLGIIAENFDVRVADLKYWNNIFNERKIQAGKNLDIFVDEYKVVYYLGLINVNQIKKEGNSMVEQIKKSSTLKVFKDLNAAKKIEHIVKSGESPYLIAKNYAGVTPDEILEWNNIDDARKIQIGQKLIVYLK